MARDKEFEYRMQGLVYAYEIVKQKGAEALDQEIKRRNITKIPMSVKQTELKRIWDELCQNMYNNITVCFLYCLREEYHFGKIRTQRLMDRYQKTVNDVMDVDYMGEHYIRMEDYAIEVNEKLGVNLDVERVAASQDVYDETGRESQYHTVKVEKIIAELEKAEFKEAAEYLRRKLA